MLLDDTQALTQHFVSNWATVSTTVPVFYDNQPNAIPPAKAAWVRFSVRLGGSIHHAGSADDGVKKQLGRVWLQIFVPSQTGMGKAYTLAEGFALMFRNQRLDSHQIHLSTEDVSDPRDAGDSMMMMTVSVPFESYRRY